MTDTTLEPAELARTEAAPAGKGGAAYRVLARKYRPQNFDELVGQDALVRTLRNAIQSGRIHQAYMLTGVRGVGKTTTARIIARALNCVGPDGKGGPTISPCGVCEQCVSIAADRNVDVLEMDAASNTGVDNIREIIDGVRYAPAGARYKLYIIDEVHMLSKGAFNALLKTLEEPPPHVKFVFATTEIRKVPVTVLSRCQRFDLRRVDHATLVGHFTRVSEKEGVAAEPEAIALIARAADGSVRDGLSLLDQAIALGGGQVTAQQVRDMLGLADRSRVIDLFASTLTGRTAEALDILDDMHKRGADPIVVVQDLLDFTHFLTRARVVPGTADDPSVPEEERTRGVELAGKLGMPALSRAWQILLKGLNEVSQAPVPQQALEMLVIRLAYASDLPSPGDLIKKIQEAGGAEAAARALLGPNGPGGGNGAMALAGPAGAPQAMHGGAPMALVSGGRAQGLARPLEQPAATVQQQPAVAVAAGLADPQSFPEVVKLFMDRREGALGGMLHSATHLVRFEAGLIELRPASFAPANLAGRVGQCLTEWTGRRWVVSVSSAPGAPTLAEQEKAALARVKEEAAKHPVVQAVLSAFPGAKIEQVRDLAAEQAAEQAAAAAASLPDSDDDSIPDNPYFDAPPADDGDWEGDF
ncbi:DNA polymerase III subunit gamma/tau [Indioceanicola profundi]|uniref:DNA polymerase III subunit gamma/tau n=1 Tax=Indioceanicola profundi TaxID=2220096 RepID=UPI000E6A9E55|nr:DNA polymerase III subunit gamma/tau [Indioceanicola profundi]